LGGRHDPARILVRGPVNTNVSLTFRVHTGPQLVTEVSEASLQVIGGDFVIEFDIPVGVARP